MLRTVLLDDERPALKALEHLLGQYPTIEIAGSFTDVDQALELIKSGNIHLLFLDIDMPKQTGIEVAKKVYSQNSSIKIIFITAYQQFAVDAFEVNAIDYIMKPVSPKRLDSAIKRLALSTPAQDHSVIRQKQTEFLNQLLTAAAIAPETILTQAAKLSIDFAHPFSFYFLLPGDARKQARTDFIDKLVSQPGFMAWETPHGIGILDYTVTAPANAKELELANASTITTIVGGYFPQTKITIGIAEYDPKIENFVNRYIQARNTAVLALPIARPSGVYHFLDRCFLPVLDQYIHEQSCDTLIDHTIGKILEYDRLNDTDLFCTMEQILFCNTLQEVATALFVHYKTIIFRKQNIEKLLGISLNSFSGRTMLGVALTLFYLKNIPTLSDN
ncbi:MAG: two component transcriptional regulator, LytTR family [Firmicutes bacterium]|nr:two component transcriptional regulator, LytTR family [Bacillota bacterium]